MPSHGLDTFNTGLVDATVDVLTAWFEGVDYTGLNAEAVAVAHRAVDLDLMQEAGAVFAYPDALDLTEWLGLRCLVQVRRAQAAQAQTHQRKEAGRRGEKAQLTALSRRNT